MRLIKTPTGLSIIIGLIWAVVVGIGNTKRLQQPGETFEVSNSPIFLLFLNPFVYFVLGFIIGMFFFLIIKIFWQDLKIFKE